MTDRVPRIELLRAERDCLVARQAGLAAELRALTDHIDRLELEQRRDEMLQRGRSATS